MMNSQLLPVLFEEIRLLRKEVSVLTSKLNETLYIRPYQVDSDNLENKITNLLHELRIPANLKGYSMLRDAIKLGIQDFNLMSASTTKLYPLLAEKYETTPARVERAIRHAIESSWNKNKQHTFYLHYPVMKPTNSQFMAEIVDRFKLEEKCAVQA